MTNCKNCGEPLTQVLGKRIKQFCNSTCRSNFWQKQKRILQNINKAEIRPNPAEKIPEKEGEVSCVLLYSELGKKIENPAIILPASPVPEKLPGESALDYKIRISDLNQKL